VRRLPQGRFAVGCAASGKKREEVLQVFLPPVF